MHFLLFSILNTNSLLSNFQISKALLSIICKFQLIHSKEAKYPKKTNKQTNKQNKTKKENKMNTMWLAFKALFGFWKERWGWKENA